MFNLFNHIFKAKKVRTKEELNIMQEFEDYLADMQEYQGYFEALEATINDNPNLEEVQ